MNQSGKNTLRGFTLIELMVTIAVLAIIAALAAPSFRELLAAQRMRALAHSLIGDLILARSEAVKRGENITLTPLTTTWSEGWRVQVTSSSEIIGSQNTLGRGITISTPNNSPTLASLTIDRNGRAVTTNIVRFEITDGATQKRCISLDPSGRPKSTKSECPT